MQPLHIRSNTLVYVEGEWYTQSKTRAVFFFKIYNVHENFAGKFIHGGQCSIIDQGWG